MKFRNKKTGETFNAIIREASDGNDDYELVVCDLDSYKRLNELSLKSAHAVISDRDKSLAQLNEEWEDYKPKEPIFDDEKVSKAIRAWLSMQVQPIEAVSILCSKDSDGFFSYHLYGYIAKARIADGKAVVNKNLASIGFDFRSDTYFKHERGRDYSIAELCGEETPEPLEPSFIDLDERIREREEE